MNIGRFGLGLVLLVAVGIGAPAEKPSDQLSPDDLTEYRLLIEEKARLQAVEQYYLAMIARRYQIGRGDKVDWDTGVITRAAAPAPEPQPQEKPKEQEQEKP